MGRTLDAFRVFRDYICKLTDFRRKMQVFSVTICFGTPDLQAKTGLYGQLEAFSLLRQLLGRENFLFLREAVSLVGDAFTDRGGVG